MHAILYHRYGSPDVVEYTDVEKPTPGPDEALIRVLAASVNPYDWHFLTPAPINGQFYGPPMTGNFPINPYFPGPSNVGGFGPMPGGPPPGMPSMGR